MRVVFLSTCSVKCHFMNIALAHQMKALMNEKKCNHSELKVRKDEFTNVMEDILFNQIRKKNFEGHPHSPREEKKTHNGKKEHAS